MAMRGEGKELRNQVARGKLKLNYIIVDALPDREIQFLKQNLQQETLDKNGITVIWLGETTVHGTVDIQLSRFEPQKSILVSMDDEKLNFGNQCGYTTIGYINTELRARAHVDKSVDNVEKVDDSTCVMARTLASVDMWAEGFDEIGLEFLLRVYERHHGMPWTILETERCIVKEFSMEYLDDLFDMYAGEGMTDYMEPLFSYEKEKEYQEAYIKHMYGFYGYGMWIVCDKQNGKLIGRAGVEHREELDGELELGYAISVPYQCQGYATEVCAAILEYVRDELEQDSICCLIEEGNFASICLARKLEFEKVEELCLSGKQMLKYQRNLK